MTYDKKAHSVVYQCVYCGKTELRQSDRGRPMPGYCPRRGDMRDGKPYPHRWVISRKI